MGHRADSVMFTVDLVLLFTQTKRLKYDGALPTILNPTSHK